MLLTELPPRRLSLAPCDEEEYGYGEKLFVQNIRRWRMIGTEWELLYKGHDCRIQGIYSRVLEIHNGFRCGIWDRQSIIRFLTGLAFRYQ